MCTTVQGMLIKYNSASEAVSGHFFNLVSAIYIIYICTCTWYSGILGSHLKKYF